MHAVLPVPSPDEVSAQKQIIALKRTLRRMEATLKQNYQDAVEPAYKAANDGKAPQTYEEIMEILARHPMYQSYKTLGEQAQTLMWTLVQQTVNRELERISAEAKVLMETRPAGGSVTLDPEMTEPSDVLIVPIHHQPGGYMKNLGPGDIKAGALYEMGGRIYTYGLGTKSNDSKGHFLSRQIMESNPGFCPKRILDVGCSCGAATVVYKDMFPTAQVVGIDVSPSMMRYAHARAESLGLQVDFSQMNGVDMKFPDDHFDLIVSNNLMHEVSTENFKKILLECHRVLAPGGVLVFQELPISWSASKPTPIEQALLASRQLANNEPHFIDCAQRDAVACLREAGFAPEDARERIVLSSTAPWGKWYLLEGRKRK